MGSCEGRWMAFYWGGTGRIEYFVPKKEDQLRLTAKAEHLGVRVVTRPPNVPKDGTKAADAFLNAME